MSFCQPCFSGLSGNTQRVRIHKVNSREKGREAPEVMGELKRQHQPQVSSGRGVGGPGKAGYLGESETRITSIYV